MSQLIQKNQTEIYEDFPDHGYCYEIPNIIDDLDIHPYAYRIYGYLKRFTRFKNYCDKTNAEICEKIGISLPTYLKYRKELEKPFIKLGGKPLIHVHQRMNQDGSFESTVITISSIWKENEDFYKNKRETTI